MAIKNKKSPDDNAYCVKCNNYNIWISCDRKMFFFRYNYSRLGDCLFLFNILFSYDHLWSWRYMFLRRGGGLIFFFNLSLVPKWFFSYGFLIISLSPQAIKMWGRKTLKYFVVSLCKSLRFWMSLSSCLCHFLCLSVYLSLSLSLTLFTYFSLSPVHVVRQYDIWRDDKTLQNSAFFILTREARKI